NPSNNFVGNVSSPFSSTSSRPWIIDSGASHHMCHDRTLFSDLSSLSHAPNVCLPPGASLPIEGIVTIHLAESLTLANVYFVPSFHFNLLSIPQLTSTNTCLVLFSSTQCFFQDSQSMKLIGAGELCNGLY
ncbi:hypothetical protein I3760_13G150300, partial [Carya illinoinensis]